MKLGRSHYGVMLKRAMRNGWQNLMRNKILAVATMLIIALMFFVFNLILALSFATDSVIDQVGQKVDIAVEVQPEVENYQIQTFAETLRRRPEIKEVILIDKQSALDQFGAKYPNIIGFLENHNIGNPLPNTLRIINYNIADNNKVINFLERPEYARIINQGKLRADLDQKTRNQKILDITRFINHTGLWLNVIVALVAILIIFNSININIHTHKHEIKVMQLVGAKHRYIRSGYLFEGIMYSLAALAFSILISQGILRYISTNLLEVIENESLLVGINAILFHFEDQFAITLSLQILVALAFGLISSYLAIELYLRRTRASASF